MGPKKTQSGKDCANSTRGGGRRRQHQDQQNPDADCIVCNGISHHKAFHVATRQTASTFHPAASQGKSVLDGSDTLPSVSLYSHAYGKPINSAPPTILPSVAGIRLLNTNSPTVACIPASIAAGMKNRFAMLCSIPSATNVITGAQVSDKKIRAYRANLGAYVTDDFDLQFAFDHVDDGSGVRGAKMLGVLAINAMDTKTICWKFIVCINYIRCT